MMSSNGHIFRAYWPFVRGIHRSPTNSPHKGQRRGALMFSLICALNKNGWVNNREADDFRRHRAHYDVTVMIRSNSMVDKIYAYALIIDTYSWECWPCIGRVSGQYIRYLAQYWLGLYDQDVSPYVIQPGPVMAGSVEVSGAWPSNCIPQNTAGCNYLAMPPRYLF